MMQRVFVAGIHNNDSPLTNDAQLVSLGLIHEDGERTFYSVLKDSYSHIHYSDIELYKALSLLNAPDLPHTIDYNSVYARMTIKQTVEHLSRWLEQFGESVQLCAYFTEHAAHYLPELFSGHQWPRNVSTNIGVCIPFNPILIQKFQQIADMAFSESFSIYHALDTAKAIRLATIGCDL